MCDFYFHFDLIRKPHFFPKILDIDDECYVLWSFFLFFDSSSFPVVVNLNWFLGDVKHLKNCRAAELSMPYVHPGSSPLSLSIHVCKIFIYITNSNLSNLNSLFKYHKFLLFKIDKIVLSIYSLWWWISWVGESPPHPLPLFLI